MNYDILIIDDDTNINNLTAEALRQKNYTCIQAFSGTEGMSYIKNDKFCVIILDLMLPGMSGEAIIKKSKAISDTPIIILSAKGDTDGKVTCLEAGADDYLTKPFEIKELLARVLVQIRRNSTNNTSTAKDIVFKDLTLYANGYCLSVGNSDNKISLTRQEYRISELLISSPKQVFSKQAVFDYAWNEYYIGEDKTVNVHISNIRKKLRKYSDTEYISTIWGIGFKMNED